LLAVASTMNEFLGKALWFAAAAATALLHPEAAARRRRARPTRMRPLFTPVQADA
jgi:hypothetical protein